MKPGPLCFPIESVGVLILSLKTPTIPSAFLSLKSLNQALLGPRTADPAPLCTDAVHVTRRGRSPQPHSTAGRRETGAQDRAESSLPQGQDPNPEVCPRSSRLLSQKTARAERRSHNDVSPGLEYERGAGGILKGGRVWGEGEEHPSPGATHS